MKINELSEQNTYLNEKGILSKIGSAVKGASTSIGKKLKSIRKDAGTDDSGNSQKTSSDIFSNMSKQLLSTDRPSSTGGRIAKTPTGKQHRASNKNPNQPKPATDTPNRTPSKKKTSKSVPNNLTKDWIQYLKNNQIAELTSDPSTGKLKYRKPVTIDILANFLNLQGYTEDQINNAIAAVKPSQPTSSTKSEPTGTTYDTSKNKIDKVARNKEESDLRNQQIEKTKQANIKKSREDAAIKAAADIAKAKPGFQQTSADKLAIKAAQQKGIREGEIAKLVKEKLDNTAVNVGEDDIEKIFSKISVNKPMSEENKYMNRILELSGIGK